MAAIGKNEAVNEEFEGRIAEDPENLETYAVYADWLQKQGNPRGELMAIECELERLYRARRKLMTERMREFYGDLVDHTGDLDEPYHYGDYDPEVNLTWTCGFVSSIYVRTDAKWEEPEERMADFVRRVLSLSSVRHLREVHISTSGDIPAEQQADLGVSIRAFSPALERIHFSPFATAREHVDALFAGGGPWPRLKMLDLYRLQLEGGLALLKNHVHALPALKHIAFSSLDGGGDLITALTESPLLEQLEILDLSYGSLRDEDVQPLRDKPERFQHLKRLMLRSNNLTDTTFPGLDNVTVGNQH